MKLKWRKTHHHHAQGNNNFLQYNQEKPKITEMEGKWREQELMPFCKISKASKFYIHASLSAPGLIWFQKLSTIELD